MTATPPGTDPAEVTFFILISLLVAGSSAWLFRAMRDLRRRAAARDALSKEHAIGVDLALDDMHPLQDESREFLSNSSSHGEGELLPAPQRLPAPDASILQHGLAMAAASHELPAAQVLPPPNVSRALASALAATTAAAPSGAPSTATTANAPARAPAAALAALTMAGRASRACQDTGSATKPALKSVKSSHDLGAFVETREQREAPPSVRMARNSSKLPAPHPLPPPASKEGRQESTAQSL